MLSQICCLCGGARVEIDVTQITRLKLRIANSLRKGGNSTFSPQISSIARKLIAIGTLAFFAALVLNLVFARGPQVPTTPRSRVTASLAASPANYNGPCPAVIKLTGQIFMKAKGTVRYTFLRSDGMMYPIRELVFPGPGAKPVETTWSLGGTAVPSYSGWVAIKVLSPIQTESPRAEFDFDCK